MHGVKGISPLVIFSFVAQPCRKWMLVESLPNMEQTTLCSFALPTGQQLEVAWSQLGIQHRVLLQAHRRVMLTPLVHMEEA